jgi:type 1 glutamine amidotransferase
VRTLGAQNGFDVDATEDDRAFTAPNLARYDAVIFLLTTGDVLDNAEQTAFESYIRAGGSYVGVHSASDTERDWPWYGRLVGAWSSGHPEIQEAALDVATPGDDSTAPLPARWTRTDEWYGFLTNPRANSVRVLISIDESTYQAREWTMGSDHPIAWSHEFDGGRAWYTAGGHTEESYSEPLFLAHLLGGIEYALDTPPSAKPAPETAGPPTIRSLGVSVRNGRLAVTVRHSGCARCQAVLRVRAKTTKLKVAAGLATGTSPLLPPGRWQLTVALTDGETGLTRAVRRWVRVG